MNEFFDSFSNIQKFIKFFTISNNNLIRFYRHDKQKQTNTKHAHTKRNQP